MNLRRILFTISTCFLITTTASYTETASAYGGGAAVVMMSSDNGEAERKRKKERALLSQANERNRGGVNYSADASSEELKRRYIDNGYSVIYTIEYDEFDNPIEPDETIYKQCNNLNTVNFLRRDWNITYSETYYRIVCK